MAIDSPTSWKELVFKHWDLLDRLAHKRFPDDNMADQALLFVQEGLEANDWKRVRAFQGKVAFHRFLSHVCCRLLEDFARNKFGRVRPPVWVQKKQGPWLAIFKMLCLERFSPVDVVETLCTSAPGGRDRNYIEKVIWTIKERIPNCGQRTAQQVDLDCDQVDMPDAPKSEDMLPPEERMLRREREAALDAFSFIVDDSRDRDENGDCPDREPSAMEKLFNAFRENLSLENEDRLFLTMVFQDGMNVSAAGRMLEWRADQAHSRLQKLLRQMRNILRDKGIYEELEEMVR